MVDELNSTSETVETLPPMGAEKTTVEGAEKSEAKEAGTPAPKAERTYTEKEWNKRQSVIDKRTAELTKRLEELESSQALAEANVREQIYSGWLKEIENSGGNVDAAGKAIAGIKAEMERVKTLSKREAEINQKAAILNEAGKARQAEDFVKQYNLPPEIIEELLDSKDTLEMENKALKLSLQGKKIADKPSTIVDGKQTKQTTPDYSKMPPSVVLGQLMEQALKK